MTDILQGASDLINGDRAATYGNPKDQYVHLAGMLNSLLGTEMDFLDAINVMILVKLNRVRPGKPFHRDTYVDIAGYAGIAGRAYGDEQDSYWSPPQDFWDGIDQSIVEAQEKRERDRTSRPPRVWDKTSAIPEGVEFKTSDGDRWMFIGGKLHWPERIGFALPESVSLHATDFDAVWGDPVEHLIGPFTEVLDVERAEARSSSGPASPDRAEPECSE